MRRLAGLPTAVTGPDEAPLLRRLSSLLHVDDPERAETYALLMSDHDEMQPVMTTEGKPLKEYVEAFERMLIDNTMRRHRGAIVQVMEELCLPRRTLNEKMAKYGLSRSDYL